MNEQTSRDLYHHATTWIHFDVVESSTVEEIMNWLERWGDILQCQMQVTGPAVMVLIKWRTAKYVIDHWKAKERHDNVPLTEPEKPPVRSSSTAVKWDDNALINYQMGA